MMILDRKATVAKPNGYTVSDGKLGKIEHDTLCCVHCGEHWQYRPNSGIVRGFCQACNGPICGAKCKEHYPLEKRFDDYERGLIKNLEDPIDAILPKHSRIILP